MIKINSQEIRYFYRNIVKSGNVYRIKYNNKDYGEFKKLSDALYERDALFYCNFDYDLLVECDLENKYENMTLPPFPEKRSKGRIKGIKVNKKEREGEILFDHKKRGFYIGFIVYEQILVQIDLSGRFFVIFFIVFIIAFIRFADVFHPALEVGRAGVEVADSQFRTERKQNLGQGIVLRTVREPGKLKRVNGGTRTCRPEQPYS